jgi:3-hydroxyacyl-CoA dehydrogenase/enoyl-CoA hydratase/3-hydroxybutyryl-CoA epimerase
MQLVEVVEPQGTAKEVIARARAFVGHIDRLPIPVASTPGFLVNRALMPYLLEAILLCDEGVDAETIDRAAETFGMPLGPLELADHVGLDICLDVAEMLRERLKSEIPPVPGWLRDKVEKGELGRKSGQGIYAWEEGKPQKREDMPTADAALLDRLLLPLLNTCIACLREGVVADEELLDGALIFGTGFAPFRGGPLNYARNQGIGEVVKRLSELAEKHGKRFAPDPGWDELAG